MGYSVNIIMKNIRTTDGGKGDGDRTVRPKFEVGYGKVANFASNNVFTNDRGDWFFYDRNKLAKGPFATRLSAIHAYQAYYQSDA